MINRSLTTAVNQGSDIDARSDMLQAAAIAVAAGTLSIGENLVHNLSHAFGALYHIPHGRANAVLLPILLEEVAEFYLPNAEKLSDAFGIPTQGLSEKQILHHVTARIREINRDCGTPETFAEFGLAPSQRKKMLKAIKTDPLYGIYAIPDDNLNRIIDRLIG